VFECIGNYSIPTVNYNVESVDMLTGAGILNYLFMYNGPPLMLLIILLIILGFGVEFPELYIMIPIKTVSLQA